MKYLGLGSEYFSNDSSGQISGQKMTTNQEQIVATISLQSYTSYVGYSYDESSAVREPPTSGTTETCTDYTDQVMDTTTYAPFGEVLTGGTATRFGYEAKEQSVLGDTDFHFRKYLPQYGVFTQPDTLIQNVYDPQMLNRYSFERNNPHNKIDRDGHVALLVAGIIVVAGTIYAEGDTVLYANLVAGYVIEKIKNKDPQLEKEIDQGLDEAIENTLACLSPITLKGWITVGGDYKKLRDLNKRVDSKKVIDKAKDKAEKKRKENFGDSSNDNSKMDWWDRYIDENKKNSAAKEAMGYKFKGYDNNGRAIWEK